MTTITSQTAADIRIVAGKLSRQGSCLTRLVPVAARKYLVETRLAIVDLESRGYLGCLPQKRHRLANIAAGEEL